MISVCIATFNGEQYLQSQLDSIIKQLSDDDEVIIVDDCSYDTSVSIIQAYKDYRIRLYVNNYNVGIVKSFEIAITIAQGQYVFLCDQDDIWLPGRLDCFRNELICSDLVLFNARVVDENVVDSGRTLFDLVGRRKGFTKNVLKNSFVGCCMAFRRDLLKLALPFPHNLPWHDWYIGLIGELFFRVKRIEEPFLLYRRHGQNFSETGGASNYSLYKKCTIRFWILYAIIIAALRYLRIKIASKQVIK